MTFNLSSQQHSASGANTQEFSHFPKALFCYGCNKEKPLNSFSASQLRKASPVNPYAPSGRNKPHQPTCKACTPGVTTQLTCMTCCKTKPLSQFAKAQRRHGDSARCLECMAKREEEDSDFDLDDDEERDLDDPKYYSDEFDDLI